MPPTAPVIRLSLPSDHLATALVVRPAYRGGDHDAVISQSAGELDVAAREPLAEHIGDLRTIDLPDLSVAPMPPVELLGVFGADDITCQAVLSAHAGVALALLRPRSEAQSAQRAVRAASALLSGPDDVTIDTAVPRVWPVRDRSVDVPRTADWFVLERLSGGGRVGTRTHGLGRFGLPELLVEGVDGDALPAWDAVFVGVAHVLLARLSSARTDELVLENPLRLTVGDIAAGYAEAVEESDRTLGRSTDLRLRFVDSSDEADAGVLVLAGFPARELFERANG